MCVVVQATCLKINSLFCDVDFGSYDPTFLGFPKGKRVGLEDWNFVNDIMDKALSRDKYCPNCNHRLAFKKQNAMDNLLNRSSLS